MPGENEFDMSSALTDISSSLGFDDGEGTSGGEQESKLPTETGDAGTVTSPAVSSTAAGTTAGDTDPPPVGAAPGQGPSPAATTDPAAPTAETPPAADTPPSTWRKEAAATWASLPPQAKEEIRKREADIFAGIEGYKADASLGRSLKPALDPYLPILQQHGIDPAAQVGGLMKAHFTLATGTGEEKLGLFRKLAADYGVDLGQLGTEPPYVDPAVARLQTQIEQINMRTMQSETARVEQEKAEKVREIEAFAADPANPLFKDVLPDMVQLVQSGVCKSLREAYDKAIWLNPAVRSKEMARQQAEATAKAAKEASERVEAAKKASAANVRAKEKVGSAAALQGSIDDTLRTTYAAISSRG